MKKSISVSDVTKTFKKFTAIKDVTFDVSEGSIHGFIGPNGSGKTTVIKTLIGAYLASSGDITVGNYPAGSMAANALIGYIPERASFPPYLNAIEFLVSMAEQSGLKVKDAKVKSLEILKQLGLEEHAKRKPDSFSSGMQKKILLAQALISDPKILILDEPAANLDPTARKELFDQLIKLKREGKTILISSHILAELERLIDEVTFLYYGEVVFSGTVKELQKQNSNVFIKVDNKSKFTKYLVAKGYQVSSIDNIELKIKNVRRTNFKKLMSVVSKSDVEVTSIRNNDLQSIYDALIAKSAKGHRGQQKTIKKKSFFKKGGH